MYASDILQDYFTDFSPKQIEQFAALEDLYTLWNAQINVISRKDMDGLYVKHVLHSLAIAAIFPIAAGSQVMDVGTGGGFPGIPLAIFFPEVEFTLVDSIGKKLKVVDDVAAQLGLHNVQTIHGRAEAVSNKKFDFVTSRAVAPLKDLWHWAKPLIKNKRELTVENETAPGLFCLKGGDLAQEISEAAVKPHVVDIKSIFPLPYFDQKYLLYVPK